MTDRIEELLAELAAEDDEEEREDIIALPVTKRAVPDSPRRNGEDAGGGGMEDKNGGQTAEEIMPERSGPVTGERLAEERATPGELWKAGPVWTVRGVEPETDGVQRSASSQSTGQAEKAIQTARCAELIWPGFVRAARDGMTGPAPEVAGRSGDARAGLEGLYRQSVRGLRPAAPAFPPEQAGRATRTREPESAASLAVDELDRAVRRDSRRYDGGMSIY